MEVISSDSLRIPAPYLSQAYTQMRQPLQASPSMTGLSLFFDAPCLESVLIIVSVFVRGMALIFFLGGQGSSSSLLLLATYIP